MSLRVTETGRSDAKVVIASAAKQSESERARKDQENGHLNTPAVHVFLQTAAGAGTFVEIRLESD
ncbi:hypothetical protein [Cyclobacterium salsum]|uniref:hypothetical protein n=1 Tax=Cyclobacterium salsum TaxID=2666329 RepID=UPI001390F6E8|nr:hypothetical protein [Cyclobacterium salsum]